MSDKRHKYTFVLIFLRFRRFIPTQKLSRLDTVNSSLSLSLAANELTIVGAHMTNNHSPCINSQRKNQSCQWEHDCDCNNNPKSLRLRVLEVRNDLRRRG